MVVLMREDNCVSATLPTIIVGGDQMIAVNCDTLNHSHQVVVTVTPVVLATPDPCPGNVRFYAVVVF